MQKTRIGLIEFLNCLPIKYGLDCLRDSSFKRAVPTVLNNLILSGGLDISPVSSILYAQNQDKLVLLPNLSISARGALKSIILVSRFPITELGGKNIVLTAKSATSQMLLKLILAHSYAVSATFSVCDILDIHQLSAENDGMLLIGDDALLVNYNRKQDYYYYDLGAEWRKLTGLGMVYALWGVNRKFAQNNSILIQPAYVRIMEALTFGLSDIKKAAENVQAATPFSAEQITDYIKLLNYDLSAEHIKALHTYYCMAYYIGLIKQVPAIEFVKVN